jgi:predicted N-formylglutamate amidohydrolase
MTNAGAAATSALPPLLGDGEPPAVEIVNPDSEATCFLVCDHASKRLPRRLGDLGLTDAARESHIGWDIGAADLARRLAAGLNATLLLSGYSRLAIDCNRPLASPGSVPASSAGIAIPGNHGLDPLQIAQRRNSLFHPYHQAIAQALDRRRDRGQATALFSIHSFSPDVPGQCRPWHVEFAYNRDRRLAGLLLDSFAAEHDLTVGDNLPYNVDDESDHTIPVHGERRSLPHVLIEIRQDTLASPALIDRWAERLLSHLRRLLPELDRLAATPS